MGLRTPFLAGLAAFILSIGLVLVFDTVIGVVAVELLVILIYLLGVHVAKRDSVSA